MPTCSRITRKTVPASRRAEPAAATGPGARTGRAAARPPAVFQPPERYPELDLVHRSWRLVRDEALAARDALLPITDTRVDRPGAWCVLPLLPEEEDRQVATAAICERARARAPRTCALMDAIDGVKAYAFSVVAPGCRIRRHRHHNDFVTALLTLQAERADITVDGVRAECRIGEFLVFDYRLPHETVNGGSVDRVALLVLLANRG